MDAAVSAASLVPLVVASPGNAHAAAAAFIGVIYVDAVLRGSRIGTSRIKTCVASTAAILIFHKAAAYLAFAASVVYMVVLQ